MNNSGLLKKEDLKIISNLRLESITDYIQLKEKNILTESIRDILLASNNADEVCHLLLKLDEEKLLTEYNIQIFLNNKTSFIFLAENILLLHKFNLITPENLELIQRCSNQASLSSLCKLLESKNLFSEHHFHNLIKSIEKNPDVQMFQACRELLMEGMLNHDNLELLLKIDFKQLKNFVAVGNVCETINHIQKKRHEFLNQLEQFSAEISAVLATNKSHNFFKNSAIPDFQQALTRAKDNVTCFSLTEIIEWKEEGKPSIQEVLNNSMSKERLEKCISRIENLDETKNIQITGP